MRHSIFRPEPVGWGRRSQKILYKVISEADQYIQRQNDLYTKPSGNNFVKATTLSEINTGSKSSEGRGGEDDEVSMADEISPVVDKN
ncbi:MAG: hypothetical protein OEY89_14835 [Gammaproteobacteria bacterium]|nr:hypothetical protein [Gammaproteobacteria bacterium]